jgi:hypothetical protein
VPKRHIVQGLRQDVLEWLIARQSKAVEKYGVKDPRIAAFIILDDVIADQKTIRWSADLQRFFVQGRHLAITVFIASQYLKGVGPMVRGNCDYIFLQPVSLFKKCMREYCLLARDDKSFHADHFRSHRSTSNANNPSILQIFNKTQRDVIWDLEVMLQT